MTDRNAYLSYLEVQLEKVTSACLTVQGFSSRIAQVSLYFCQICDLWNLYFFLKD